MPEEPLGVSSQKPTAADAVGKHVIMGLIRNRGMSVVECVGRGKEREGLTVIRLHLEDPRLLAQGI